MDTTKSNEGKGVVMNNKQELARKIYDHKLVEKITKKINLLGINTKLDTISFLNIRIVTSAIVFILSLYIFDLGYIFAPILTIIYYYLYEKIMLDDKIKNRRENLESEAMNFFEILTLSLETGRNLEEALNVTINSVDGELSLEFKEAIRETNFGKSLKESLIDMQKYIPSESINNIILALTQANMSGSSIIDTMYNQIDYMREKRKLEIKAEISKVPVKISIISVFFFIPLILLIILGPVILSYIG